jgi:hypothetical protein
VRSKIKIEKETKGSVSTLTVSAPRNGAHLCVWAYHDAVIFEGSDGTIVLTPAQFKRLSKFVFDQIELGGSK